MVFLGLNRGMRWYVVEFDGLFIGCIDFFVLIFFCVELLDFCLVLIVVFFVGILFLIGVLLSFLMMFCISLVGVVFGWVK